MIKFIESVFINLNGWGYVALTFILGIAEFSFGLYEKKWNKNEMFTDIACYTLPKLVVGPAVAYFGLKTLPVILSDYKNALLWIPFAWGALIIAIYDDLTQYWYTLSAHSSIPWDKPFYKYEALHPIAWVFERTISTPATHHAHHANTTDDGVGYYKGNFGNMFFVWDVIFGTGLITRQYPKSYGISHYEGDPWYAQLLWPIFKSPVPGSELSAGGPAVREDVFPVPSFETPKLDEADKEGEDFVFESVARVRK